jgi:hypothetical protein
MFVTLCIGLNLCFIIMNNVCLVFESKISRWYSISFQIEILININKKFT